MNPCRLGVLLVVSGPSGTGKTTLCRQLADAGEAHYSISCTTRLPREGEVQGQSYHFLSKAEFEELLEAGAFLEYAEVHGNYYGTLKSEVLHFLQEGKDVVMDIDVQGAEQIRNSQDSFIQRSFEDVFVMPESLEALEERLRARASDDESVIITRLNNAREEMQHWQKYRYVLVSGSREEDASKFRALFIAQRLRVSRLSD